MRGSGARVRRTTWDPAGRNQGEDGGGRDRGGCWLGGGSRQGGRTSPSSHSPPPSSALIAGELQS
jgi:hypothetical protein